MPIPRSRRRALIGGTAAAIALLAVVAFVVTWRGAAAATTLEDGHRLGQALDRTLAGLNSAESALRGFVITGDSLDARLYHEAIGRHDRWLDSLRGLAALRGHDSTLFQTFAGRAALRRELLDSVFEMRAEDGDAAAIRMIATGRPQAAMDSVRVLGARLQAADDRYVAAAQRQQERLRTLAYLAIGAGGGIGLLLTLLTGGALSRTVEKLRASIAEVENRSRQLEETALELELSNEELQASSEELEVAIAESDERRHELETSERRLRTLVAATSAVAWSAGARGTFETEQAGWDRYTGQAWPAHQGLGWLAMVHADDRPALEARWATAAERPQPFEVDLRLWHAPTLAWRHATMYAAPVLGHDGRVQEWTGAFADIEDRRRAESAAREAEARRLLAVEITGLGTWVADVRGPATVPAALQVQLDEGAARLHACDASRPVPFADLLARVHAEDRERLVHALEATIARGDANAAEYRLAAADAGAGVRWIATRMQAADGDESGTRRIFAVALDASDRKRVEERLQQAERLGAVGRLAGGVAHEINNALTATLGFSHLAQQQLAPEHSAHAHLDQVIRASDRAASIARQLLAFTRRQVFHLEVLDPNLVVDELAPMLRRLLGADYDFVTELLPAVGQVHVDRGQLEQVLVNLALNARDAMSAGGRLTISTTRVELDGAYAQLHQGVQVRPGTYVQIAVGDTGSGMDAATRERAFEPFFTTKPVGKGTGLGLSTVYGVVKQSEGYVWVYSEPGLGTTVKVYLPLVHAAPAAARGRAPGVPRGTERVLVVEDEGQVRELVAATLRGLGYDVHTAADGSEALSRLEQLAGDVDLVLTDLVMPAMNGRQLASAARERFPRARWLFMSGYTGEDVAERGLIESGAPFVQKPFAPDGLAREVRLVLERRK